MAAISDTPPISGALHHGINPQTAAATNVVQRLLRGFWHGDRRPLREDDLGLVHFQCAPRRAFRRDAEILPNAMGSQESNC